MSTVSSVSSVSSVRSVSGVSSVNRVSSVFGVRSGNSISSVSTVSSVNHAYRVRTQSFFSCAEEAARGHDRVARHLPGERERSTPGTTFDHQGGEELASGYPVHPAKTPATMPSATAAATTTAPGS